jgi:hypothetical protein
MTTGPRVIGNHGWFFHDGAAYTVPSSGNASRTAKPGAADTGWIALPILSSVVMATEEEKATIMAPTPGLRRPYSKVRRSLSRSYRLTCEEISPLAWGVAMRSLDLTSASTQYNPGEGPLVIGWLKIQQYDEQNALFNTVDSYGELFVPGDVSFGDDVVKPELQFDELHSIYNTGALA